jgi:SIR2-like domain
VQVATLGEFARAWAVQTRRIGWLLGAGASAAAGVPTAAGIVSDLLLRRYAADFNLVRQHLDPADPAVMARVRAHYDGAHGMPKLGSAGDYSAAFETAMPDAEVRRQYLRQLLSDRLPCYGQRVLGAAVAAGAADLLITTNFDELLERAVTEAHHARQSGPARLLSTAALNTPRRASTAVADDEWPLLVKLHGDFRETALKNLDSELREQDATLRRVVLDCSRRFGLAVAGYSGRDDSVMDMLAEAMQPDAWPAGLWWLTRDPHTLPDPVLTLFERARAAGVRARVVEAANFDEAMSALADQVQLDDGVRAYVNGLRPRARVTDAPLPATDGAAFPVLRLNALPITGAPGRVLRAPLAAGVTAADLRDQLKVAGWRTAAVMGAGEVLTFGCPRELHAALGTEQAPTVAEVDLLAADAPAHHTALLTEALIRGLARRLPAKPHVRSSRPRLVVVPAREGEPEKFIASRRALQQAYDEPLCGQLPRTLGTTEAGERRRFAEAVELRVERWLDQTWLVFTPSTWTEPTSEMAQASRQRSVPRPRDPAASWVAERWARRRRNEVWAGILAAWAQALAPRSGSCLVHALPRSLSDAPGAVGGSFTLGNITAYSRKATGAS